MEYKKMAAPEVVTDKPGISRRDFVSTALGASLMAMVPPGVRSGAWAAGSDAPEKKEVRIGFIPLTDCASVVMASVMKFDEKYGIKIIPTKEASWAAVRDKMVNGEIDAAHVLYGLIYGVQMGVGEILNGAEGSGDQQKKEKTQPDGTRIQKSKGRHFVFGGFVSVMVNDFRNGMAAPEEHHQCSNGNQAGSQGRIAPT